MLFNDIMRVGAACGAIVFLTVLSAGCGDDAPTAQDPSTVTVTRAPTDPDATAGWNGRMVVRYEDATSPETATGRALLAEKQALEQMADSINDGFRLPRDVPLIGTQCDQANAFWDSESQSVTICYEDAADALDIYTSLGDPDPRGSALNAEWATFLHETGHMVIDLYGLPVIGREEDAADQLAAFVLLSPGPDGKIDPDSLTAVMDFAREFQQYDARNDGEADGGQLADVHSPDLARMYNLQCWIYGADPTANADLVTGGSLPADRADGCEDEFRELSDSWTTLLDPYMK